MGKEDQSPGLANLTIVTRSARQWGTTPFLSASQFVEFSGDRLLQSECMSSSYSNITRACTPASSA